MPASAPPMDRAYLRLVGLGALIGIPAALAAALLLAAEHELEHLLWPAHPAWWLVLGLPVAGAVVVLAARRYPPGDGGHAPLVVLAALGTVADRRLRGRSGGRHGRPDEPAVLPTDPVHPAGRHGRPLLVGVAGRDAIAASVLGTAAAWPTTRALADRRPPDAGGPGTGEEDTTR